MINEINENDNYTIDCQFLPPVNWFKISNNRKYINICVYERWKKMGFGNRCTLLGGNGLIDLSVPLEKGRDQKAFFKDIKISYSDDWQLKFWRTIISCYNRSPFFAYYSDGFQEILFRKYTYLLELNLELIKLCLNYMSVNREVILVSENNFPHIDSRDYYLTPKTRRLDPDPVIYQQLFSDRHGFQPNLSIMDLLFMQGPESYYLLAK